MKRQVKVSARASCLCLAGISVGALATSTSSAALSLYDVGNSLTADTLNGGQLVAALGASGQAVTNGYHVHSGATLGWIAANPDDSNVLSVSPYNHYGNALPNYQWDVVTVQPYATPWLGTMADDLAAINQFVSLAHSNPANSATTFFVLAAWPNIDFAAHDLTQYQTQWTQQTSGLMTQNVTMSGAYFDDLRLQLHSSVPGMLFIPTGEVLYAIDQQARGGSINGLAGAPCTLR